jgi:hypothetical protein
MQEPNSNDAQSAQPPRSALNQKPDISNPPGEGYSEPLGKAPDENVTVRLPGYRREKRPRYVPVKGKFIIATTFACLWFLLSWQLAQPWLGDLAQVTGYWQAVVIIFFIALLPGFLNAHIVIAPNRYVANRGFASLYYEHRLFYTYLDSFAGYETFRRKGVANKISYTAAREALGSNPSTMSPSKSTLKAAPSPPAPTLAATSSPARDGCTDFNSASAVEAKAVNKGRSLRVKTRLSAS